MDKPRTHPGLGQHPSRNGVFWFEDVFYLYWPYIAQGHLHPRLLAQQHFFFKPQQRQASCRKQFGSPQAAALLALGPTGACNGRTHLCCGHPSTCRSPLSPAPSGQSGEHASPEQPAGDMMCL